jgi:hypothetical protein
MELNTEVLKAVGNLLSNNLFNILFSLGTIFGGLKLFIWINSMKIVSMIRIYFNRKKFFQHKVFYLIDDIIKNPVLVNSIVNVGRKEIAKKVLILQLKSIKILLKNYLKYVIRINNLFSINNFSSESIVSLLRDEYLRHIDLLGDKLRIVLIKHMSEQDFNKFMAVYEEEMYIYETLLVEFLEVLSSKKNIYETLWFILNSFEAIVETEYKTIGNRFNLLNGRLTGITYKGYSL